MVAYKKPIHIVGAGLAGSELAWQLAEKGFQVTLFEMRPKVNTPAHKTKNLAELVCSNSFGSGAETSAAGQLKWEAAQMGSLILKCASDCTVPAGTALAVNRDLFSELVTKHINSHPNITLKNEEVLGLNDVPRPTILATGPLTNLSLANSMKEHFGNDFLFFYDAIAPIIDADSIDMDTAWYGDRFDKGDKDYLNIALDKDQYQALIKNIQEADKVELKSFEEIPYFDGCQPIEAIVEKGTESLRFGALSPKGLQQQGPDFKKHAVVQLRKENKEATAFNMVGFQTKMTYPEQKRVFKTIPGLEQAEFLKLGSIHKNLYIHSPKSLNNDLSSIKDEHLFFAGQITGVEGYFESTSIGLLLADFIDQKYNDKPTSFPPRESAMGSLLNAVTEPKEKFQPTNINFSLFPVPEKYKNKRKVKTEKKMAQITRAKESFKNWKNLI